MKKLTMLMLVLISITGCNPKKSSVKANTATINGISVDSCISNNVQNSNVGTIYDQTNMFGFEARVKALLTATIDPAEVGSISGGPSDPTGVRFTGQIKLDSAGNVVSANSRITITVYDSVLQFNSSAKPIVLDLDPSKGKGVQITGRFNTGNGDGYVSINDQYGEIRLQGIIDAQKFSGTVSFTNKTNVTGGSPASGTLGQFSIQRCPFLQ